MFHPDHPPQITALTPTLVARPENFTTSSLRSPPFSLVAITGFLYTPEPTMLVRQIRFFAQRARIDWHGRVVDEGNPAHDPQRMVAFEHHQLVSANHTVEVASDIQQALMAVFGREARQKIAFLSLLGWIALGRWIEAHPNKALLATRSLKTLMQAARLVLGKPASVPPHMTSNGKIQWQQIRSRLDSTTDPRFRFDHPTTRLPVLDGVWLRGLSGTGVSDRFDKMSYTLDRVDPAFGRCQMDGFLQDIHVPRQETTPMLHMVRPTMVPSLNSPLADQGLSRHEGLLRLRTWIERQEQLFDRFAPELRLDPTCWRPHIPTLALRFFSKD